MQETNEEKKVQDKLSFIQNTYDRGEYSVVVKECCTLFEVAFKKIFSEALVSFDFKSRAELMEAEAKIGKGVKGVSSFGFGELVGLFRECKLLSRWATAMNKDMGLIESINFNSIVKLRNNLTHDGATSNRYDAELVFNCLRNMYATLGFMNLDKPITPSENNTNNDGNETELVNIKLLKDRGVIINQSDGTRNISYKVETINRMLSVAYEKIKELCNEEAAKKVLYEMGYDSGNAFGCVMNQKWELELNDISFMEKISRWCDFDSEVGWGKFHNNLVINEEEGTISGTIDITENFLCYNRKKTDVKICDFMKGYCDGVLEELLGGLSVHIECAEGSCPIKNALKKKCAFSVSIEED